MDLQTKQALLQLIQHYKKHGPQWKPGKDLDHLNKRINRQDVSMDFTLQEYNKLIVKIMTNDKSEMHIYRLDSFHQSYFAFSANDWIVIIGEDAMMETCMKSTSSERYLSAEKGYTYIGTVKEVLS